MRKVIQQLKQYKRDTLSCIGLTALEVIMEILMPFITAIIIDQGVEAGNLPVVYRYGVLMVLMAFLALVFGALAGKMRPVRRPGCPPTCGRRFMPIFRPFPFPILISSACRDWLPV